MVFPGSTNSSDATSGSEMTVVAAAASAKGQNNGNHKHNHNLDLTKQSLGSSLKTSQTTTMAANITTCHDDIVKENNLLRLQHPSTLQLADNSDNLTQLSLSGKPAMIGFNHGDGQHHDHDHHHERHHHHQDSHDNSNNGSSINNRTTDAQTMMHILKANVGTGVLAMPNAFKNVGLWLGFILIPVIGSICIHCMNILIESHNHLCDRFNYESLDYDQVAALGLACGPKFARRLAKWANGTVTVFLIITQFGFCCVYVMFVVENIQLAVLNLFKVQYSTTTYLLLVFPIIGLTSCTSNLKHLARISTFANILQLTGLSLIVFDLLKFHTYDNLFDDGTLAAPESESSLSSSSSSSPLVTSTNQTQQITLINSTTTSSVHVNAPVKLVVNQFVSDDIKNGLPLFFATAVYAFEGIGVVLPLIKEMQHPERISGLNGVLNSSMSLVALLYMAMGFFGYTKYGQFVQGSITFNLPQTNLNEFVRLIFALAIGLSYSLQFYVPWTIMWPHIDESLFYSYRPRTSRDKLQILSKLSKDNQWAFDESSFQQSSITGQQQQQQQQQQQSQSHPQQRASYTNRDFDYDNQSTATTLATSYSMSTTMPINQRRRFNLSTSKDYGGVSNSAVFNLSSSQQQQQHQQQQPGKNNKLGRLRNRLDDVVEQDDSIPEVQWRPPPSSMRGKRKLVRYTVILVTVSFTFVAAALIPRLDLFIALIGALASSCLAIIFPAIIQLCTFWSTDDDDVDEQDEHDHDDNNHDNNERRKRGRNINQLDDSSSRYQSSSTASQLGAPTRKRKLRAKILWCLFVGKNFLLVVFGILGLITGSWISISQLSAAYMALPVDA